MRYLHLIALCAARRSRSARSGLCGGPEIGLDDLRIVRDRRGRPMRDEHARFHHAGVVGDREGGTRVLFNEEAGNATISKRRDGLEDVAGDERRKAQAQNRRRCASSRVSRPARGVQGLWS